MSLAHLPYHSDGETLWAGQLGQLEAPTVVLLHPTPLDHSFWLPVAERLIGWRCVLVDLRGHGQSPLDPVPALTMQQLGRDTLALLDALGLDQAVFVGCSIGGYTLYELWRQAPERIRALGFCAAKPHPDTPVNTTWRDGWIEKMEAREAAGEPGPGDEFIQEMIVTLLGADIRERQAGKLDELRAVMRRMSPSQIAAVQRGLASRPDSRPTAQTISVPALVLAGEEDKSSTPAEMAELAALLRAAGAPVTSQVLARAGHYFPWERPEPTAEIVQGFLDTLRD